MSNLVRHPYHLVNESPWPILSAVAALNLTLRFAQWFHENRYLNALFRGLILILISFSWWRDVSAEGSFQGIHSSVVEIGLRWGMGLFIVSEIFFFLGFFWAYFHRSLAPNIEIGGRWPPVGILPFNTFEVPFLNTLILLRSGATVTWSHHAAIAGIFHEAKVALLLTITLGVYFTALQGLEYHEASFRIADRVYGSSFFLATGFHGIHVLVGTAFLFVCFLRIVRFHFSSTHHFGFEAAAWYWHFVDVVWLFLFLRIYWWGGL